MSQTWIQKGFRPVKAVLPRWLSQWIRRIGTALLTPLLFSWRTGHLRSSLKALAVSRSGQPIPWYTYPCIDFLSHRKFADKSVLEFGAGQSTLWWAQRARQVVSFEGDPAWLERVRRQVPANVTLHSASESDPAACAAEVARVLQPYGDGAFDVVVIDGLCRSALIDVAVRAVTENGLIVCDNAEGFGFFEGFRDRAFLRADFFGHAPGVVLPHCTSVFFRSGSFAFQASHPIPVIAKGA